ncbi:MAG: hypothetical protein AB7L09_01850 [Nitrospira sp.]
MTRIKIVPGYTAIGAYNGGVGSRIVDVEGFHAALTAAILAFDFTTNNPSVRTEGQGFLRLDHAAATCSAGVGHPVDSDDAYVIRQWRGKRKAFLRREYAAPVESLAVVVYSRAAYLSALDNPDTPAELAESERVTLEESDATHVVVAVLAGAGPESLSPSRLVSNLAGGNADALTWSGDEIRAKARDAQKYADEWETVADCGWPLWGH